MKKILFFSILIGVMLYARNDTYIDKLIKNRAHKQAKEGVKEHQRKLYIYADDKDIQKEIKKSEDCKEIKIASPTIGKHSSIREVNILVESKKPIKIDGSKEVSIGSPDIDRRNSIRKLIIDLNLNKKVEVK